MREGGLEGRGRKGGGEESVERRGSEGGEGGLEGRGREGWRVEGERNQ